MTVGRIKIYTRAHSGKTLKTKIKQTLWKVFFFLIPRDVRNIMYGLAHQVHRRVTHTPITVVVSVK